MKVCLVGCGGISPLHLKVYKNLNVNVTSLCDLDLERAKTLASKFGIDKTYRDYMEMLEKEKPDLVDICTPVTTHAKIVSDASAMVQAILVEKPMAYNVFECDQMIKAVRKNDCKLCIGHNQIFSPDIQKAKAKVDSGDFKLYSFKTNLKANFEDLRARDLAPAWNVSPQQRGIIWEVCCHHAYLQLHFLDDIKEVYAVGGKVKYPVYDDFAVALRTKGDRFGLIEISWIQSEMEVIYELRDISGRRIQILYDFFHYTREHSQKPPFTLSLAAKNMLVDEKRLLQKWAKFGTCYLKKRNLLPTTRLITSYIEAIEKDLPEPVPPEDGRRTIQLLESIEQSLNERRAVSISY